VIRLDESLRALRLLAGDDEAIDLLEVRQLHRQLRDQNTALKVAVQTEYRDDATQEHARRIGRTCRILSRTMGDSRAQAELLQRAAPLHDIGKIAISEAILLKPGRLSDSEFEAVKTHTTIGASILSGSSSRVLRLAEEIALSHHERWDGRGYPFGLRATEISRASRIVAVADVFDALTHERPYKRAWPLDEALSEIQGQRGRHFDPEIVDAFAALDHTTLLGPMHDPSVGNYPPRSSKATVPSTSAAPTIAPAHTGSPNATAPIRIATSGVT
jgi:putative two-component system response regulator